MWNRKVISKPPVCDVIVEVTTEQKDVLNKARTHFKEACPVTNDHLGTLSAEHFVLNRIVYKLRNQFRSEKSMRGLQQMKKCLNRLVELDMPNLIQGVEDILKLSPSTSGERVFLPSRQVLQFYLVRLVGVAGLLTQLAHYCTATFVHVKQHLEIGNMIPQNVLMLALSSRIWYVSKSLCTYTCKWYKVLLPCVKVLQPTPTPWLGKTEVLPEDLSAWLLTTFDKPTCLKTERHMTEAANTPLKTSEEIEEITGASPSHLSPYCTEDIGEVIKRQPLPDTYQGSLNTESENSTGGFIDKPNTCQDLCTDTQKTISERGDIRKYIKRILKPKLKTAEDVVSFKNYVSSAKSFQVGEFCTKLSKLEKKKIMKKISLLQEHLNEAEPKLCNKHLNTLCKVLKNMFLKNSDKESTGLPKRKDSKVDQANGNPDEENMFVNDEDDNIGNISVEQSDNVIDNVKVVNKKAKNKVKKKQKNKDKLMQKNMKQNVQFVKKTKKNVRKKIS